MSLAVSGPRDSRELYIMADRYVKNVIESAPGVGQVQISGASERAVQVNIEARRLAAYGLSIMQVREALARQNAEVPGGRIDAGFREISLRTLGRFAEPRDFLDLVVSNSGGTAVRLRDLGEVVDSRKELRTLARLDGKPAVVLQVQRQSGRQHRRGDGRHQEPLAAMPRAAAQGRLGADHPGSVAVHQRGHARDPGAPDRRQHAGQHRGAVVHAVLAQHADRGRGHSRLDHRHVHRHAVPGLHA